MKPLTMLEYVLKQHAESSNQNEFEDNCYNYAQFLSQKPEKWMFVPCDDEGNVLEEPKGEKCCAGIQNDCGCGGHLQYDDEYMHQYKQALERVIFDGFVAVNFWVESEFLYFSLNEHKTLEHLINEYGDFLTLKKPIQ